MKTKILLLLAMGIFSNVSQAREIYYKNNCDIYLTRQRQVYVVQQGNDVNICTINGARIQNINYEGLDWTTPNNIDPYILNLTPLNNDPKDVEVSLNTYDRNGKLNSHLIKIKVLKDNGY